MKPMSGTTAMESPKLKVSLSMLSKAFLLGKGAASSVYLGKKVMIIMSRIARISTNSNSF